MRTSLRTHHSSNASLLVRRRGCKYITSKLANNLVNSASKLSRNRKSQNPLKALKVPTDAYNGCMKIKLDIDMFVLAPEPILKAIVKVCINIYENVFFSVRIKFAEMIYRR